MAKDWIKLHVNRWLYGSTRDELTPAQRSVWVDLLALAGQLSKDDQESMVLNVSRPALARLFKVSRPLLDLSLSVFEEKGKITIDGDLITILKWNLYNPPRMTYYRDSLRDPGPHVTECYEVGQDGKDVTEREAVLQGGTRREEKRRDKKENIQSTDSRIGLIARALTTNRGYKSPCYAKEAKAIQWMLHQGYTPQQILGCYQELKGLPFWADKELDMASVKSQIGAKLRYKTGGTHGNTRTPRGGYPTPAEIMGRGDKGEAGVQR